MVPVKLDWDELIATPIKANTGNPKMVIFFTGESAANGDENSFEYTVNRSFYDIKTIGYAFQTHKSSIHCHNMTLILLDHAKSLSYCRRTFQISIHYRNKKAEALQPLLYHPLKSLTAVMHSPLILSNYLRQTHSGCSCQHWRH